jgi:hypothetical protein
MTIKELRKILADCPDDTRLSVYNSYLGECQPLVVVDITPPKTMCGRPQATGLIFMDVDGSAN